MRIYTFIADVNDKAYIRDKKEINHLKNVLRLKVDNNVRLIDFEFEYLAKIIEINKKEVICEILEKIEDNFSLTKDIDAYICLNKNFSEQIKALTELGIKRIVPVVSKYSTAKENLERYETIMKESLKQSLGVKKTIIEKSIQLENIDFNKYDSFIFAEERSNNNIKTIKTQAIAFIIGPEGGFSEEEKTFLRSRAKSVSLGKRVLRALTATTLLAGILSLEI